MYVTCRFAIPRIELGINVTPDAQGPMNHPPHRTDATATSFTALQGKATSWLNSNARVAFTLPTVLPTSTTNLRTRVLPIPSPTLSVHSNNTRSPPAPPACLARGRLQRPFPAILSTSSKCKSASISYLIALQPLCISGLVSSNCILAQPNSLLSTRNWYPTVATMGQSHNTGDSIDGHGSPTRYIHQGNLLMCILKKIEVYQGIRPRPA
jgi:hypothetical protein